jgi:hypothetical protein
MIRATGAVLTGVAIVQAEHFGAPMVLVALAASTVGFGFGLYEGRRL